MSGASGIEFIERHTGTWEQWRATLASEWKAYEQGDSMAIPRYSIARMLGADSDTAKKMIE